ncbi:MAG: FG-GAP repeat protein, partial [Planctomycetes bacterium]|nr:FG-GAP repeat protein [Planctomycetota bacterium]
HRVVITIVEPGQVPQTVPPLVFVAEPAFDRSVSQEDVLTVIIQPTQFAPDPLNPFDPDSGIRLFIIFDLDEDPNNDDPATEGRINEDRSRIIVVREEDVVAGAFALDPFEIRIDLDAIPPRDDGKPYHVRATVDDGTNPPVHHYAPGAISVVRLAAGTVDLGEIWRTLAGARFQGFNPAANLGSSISTVSDFDADGIEDFVLVAQFGNPQNVGPVGEAYLVYGLDKERFGGTIPVNAIAETVSGVIFAAPPIRTTQIPDPDARTDGITDVSFIDDLSGDGRPEILFGLQHVHGAYDSMDWDPGDEDLENNPDQSPFFCYPDPFVNNLTDSGGTGGRDVGFYAGGMGVVVNSSNRDNSGLINLDRLESTVINLELVGQYGEFSLNDAGESRTGFINARADNNGVADLGTDPEEEGRIAGARMMAGGYDFVFQFEPPRDGLWGSSVRSLGDLNSDGLSEIVFSAPRNERYLADLSAEFGVFSTQLASTPFEGSITVFPGSNYNTEFWRDLSDDTGTAGSPVLDNFRFPTGSCTQGRPRLIFVPSDLFVIFAEDIDDMLGEGQSAGDFNRDGLDDILAGAPLNDRNAALRDTGATYIIYGRSVFGEVQLANANDPVLRAPMLRIRGIKRGDQVGWRQTAGLDVSGDGIDDVFISSPRADIENIARTTCGGDFTGEGEFTVDDLILADFNICDSLSDQQIFSEDLCAIAFDYDNDGDVDNDDRCVFCCLSTQCDVDDSCIFGREADCCANLVDNGFAGVIFGGEFIDGDRTIAQLATSQLPGLIFYGSSAGDRAGYDVSSAGDFNQDGFGDILIAAPGEVRIDDAGRERLGVVYLIFGGTHLAEDRSAGADRNGVWNLQDVGILVPGIVFLSPYEKGRPNEAAPLEVAFIGDINNDGFDDIAIGNPFADFIDPSFPQDPNAPPSDPSAGRRSDVG